MTTEIVKRQDEILAELRAAGWMVTSHADYRLGSEVRVAWVLTHPRHGYYHVDAASDADAMDSFRHLLLVR